MIVVLSRDALTDLEEIAGFTARDDARRADRLVERLRPKCVTLSRQPARYPVVHTQAGIDLHKLAFRRYLIFYSIGPDQVDIVRIVHRARDWASLFAGPMLPPLAEPLKARGG